jgi:hypothetical protein
MLTESPNEELSYFANCVILLMALHYGLGHHMAELMVDPPRLQNALKVRFSVHDELYNPILTCCSISSSAKSATPSPQAPSESSSASSSTASPCSPPTVT